MANVRGCELPEDLLYDVENHTWFSEVGDGNVKMGMTTIATALAGELVAFTQKKLAAKSAPENLAPRLKVANGSARPNPWRAAKLLITIKTWWKTQVLPTKTLM